MASQAAVGRLVQLFPDLARGAAEKWLTRFERDRTPAGVLLEYRLLCLEAGLQAGPDEKARTLYCPACTELASWEDEGVSVFQIHCSNCGVLFRVGSKAALEALGKPRAALRISSMAPRSRISEPSCDYCGMRFSADSEIVHHKRVAHSSEEEQRMELEAELQRPLPPDAQKCNHTALQNWEGLLASHVIARMDTEESHAKKMETHKQVQAIIRVLFPSAVVHLFGSTVTRCAELTSDLDMALYLSDSAEIAEVSVLEWVWDFFRRAPLPWNYDSATGLPAQLEPALKKVTKTRVPIIGYTPPAHRMPLPPKDPSGRRVRFRGMLDANRRKKNGIDSHAEAAPEGVEKTFSDSAEALTKMLKDTDAVLVGVPNCFRIPWDISLKYYGIRNSALIREYLNRSAFRIAAVAVKVWSKNTRVNDPRVGLLSSYAVILMFIYFLVAKRHVTFIEPRSINVRLSEACCPEFRTVDRGEARRAAELLADFFAFYVKEFDWEQSVVSIREDASEKVVTKSDLQWTPDNEVLVDRANSVRFNICVEDPYEAADHPHVSDMTLNLGRKITPDRALKVRRSFRETWLNCFARVDSSQAAAMMSPAGLDPRLPVVVA